MLAQSRELPKKFLAVLMVEFYAFLAIGSSFPGGSIDLSGKKGHPLKAMAKKEDPRILSRCPSFLFL